MTHGKAKKGCGLNFRVDPSPPEDHLLYSCAHPAPNSLKRARMLLKYNSTAIPLRARQRPVRECSLARAVSFSNLPVLSDLFRRNRPNKGNAKFATAVGLVHQE